jgi:hypothetical protein
MTPTTPRRPSFARDFPPDEALDSVVEAFARGDYARVREEAQKIASSERSDEVRAAARTLVDRTKPDPLAVLLLVLTGVLLCALTAYWIVHGKPPSGPTLPQQPPVEHVH